VVSVGHSQFIRLTRSIGYFVSLAMTVNACELEAAEGRRNSQGLTGCLH
jgi:hypothetical protein